MPPEAADKPPLSFDEVAAAGLALAAERELPAVGRRLREIVESWASPSLVLCIKKDAAAGGWRTIPELSWGAASPAVESLARMIEEAPPGSLARPTLLRTEVSAANVRPRDNVVVPWSWGEAAGFLVLRGIPRPAPGNIAQAVALVCLPIWPRLHGTPAGAVARAAPDAGPLADVSALQKRIDMLEKARATAESDRDRAESEAAELRDRVEQLERQLDRGLGERRALEASREAAAGSDAALLKERLKELELVRLQLGELVDKAKDLESERATLEAERNKLRAENNTLYASIESWEREIRTQATHFEAERAAVRERTARLEVLADEAAAKRSAGEEELEEGRRTATEAESRAERAEARERYLAERWASTVAGFRAGLDALRRTPFVPPSLRVSMSGVESALAEDRAAGAPQAPLGVRVLLLDRDAAGLERLACELEAAGLEVLVAHYPEEVSFFLKTPEARRLAAAVCDVMAFRGDQDVIEAFRAWRQDLSGLALFLSFRADQPTEAERARRVPSVLTAGYLKRPLESGPLVEALIALSRRSGSRP